MTSPYLCWTYDLLPPRYPGVRVMAYYTRSGQHAWAGWSVRRDAPRRLITYHTTHQSWADYHCWDLDELERRVTEDRP